ncbi:MAG TPA: hypothetical protein VJ372_22295 [Pyrinomonadaceae bacterium]|nr:hypothetical protein [Pyrinomonadaceae bacterium]
MGEIPPIAVGGYFQILATEKGVAVNSQIPPTKVGGLSSDLVYNIPNVPD